MNFITKLFNVYNHNVIYTIINRFNKKRHYVFYTIENENTNAEIIVRIFIQYVFRIYNFFFHYVKSKFSIYIFRITNILQNSRH